MSRNVSKIGPTTEQEPEIRRQINIGFYRHIKSKWTQETLQSEANKYSTRRQFAEQNRAAYNAAVRFRLLNDVCKHMPKTYDRRIVIAKPPGKSRYELLYAPPVALSDIGSPVVAGGIEIAPSDYSGTGDYSECAA